MATLITGLFDTVAAAETAVSQLKQIGYGGNEITIVMKDRGAADNLAHDSGARTMEGVGTGATIGGAIGAVLGGLLAVGTVTLAPPIGLIAAGPLAAAIAGAGAGGIAGGLIGWLATFGISDEMAPYYEHGLKNGGVVVACSSHPGDENRVQQILQTGAVAYTGGAAGSYVSPEYRARYDNDVRTGTVSRV
ncbi:MAG TPA: hypothetical protein VKT77_00855 [Chthonomonadaceae bacterium]|nr:hypothetical protein [Chthonomonadaceae bacterium]